nr:hypothetical protein [Tanacetum cinerariifolium]
MKNIFLLGVLLSLLLATSFIPPSLANMQVFCKAKCKVRCLKSGFPDKCMKYCQAAFGINSGIAKRIGKEHHFLIATGLVYDQCQLSDRDHHNGKGSFIDKTIEKSDITMQ